MQQSEYPTQQQQQQQQKQQQQRDAADLVAAIIATAQQNNQNTHTVSTPLPNLLTTELCHLMTWNLKLFCLNAFKIPKALRGFSISLLYGAF